MSKHIVVIPGDGIGKEITDAAVKVLQKIDDKFHIGLTFETKDAGGTAYDACGTPLPDDTVEAAKKADAVLFGAVGGDQWDNVEPSAPNGPSWACARPWDCTSTSVPSKYLPYWPSIRP